MCMNVLLDLMSLQDAHKGNIMFKKNIGQIPFLLKHSCYVSDSRY